MSGFGAQCEAFAVKCGIVTDKFVRKVVLDIYARVVMKTPVDTGMLRANWQIGINQRPTGVVNGAASVDVLGGDAKNIVAGGNVYIVNNLPYAMTVELGLYGQLFQVPTAKTTAQGFSTQAPQGMARLSVREVASHLQTLGG